MGLSHVIAMHVVYHVFDQILLKDIWQWDICILPILSYNSQSHILLTLVTLPVSVSLFKDWLCLQRFTVCSPLGENTVNTLKHAHKNIRPHVCRMYTSMHVHTPAWGCTSLGPQVINAASLSQPRPDAQCSTHPRPSAHVCQTHPWHIIAPKVCTCSSASIPPWDLSQYICFGRMFGRQGELKGERSVWLKGCIDWFESTGANHYCLAQYIGQQTCREACVCVCMCASQMFMWGCAVLIYVGKWCGIFTGLRLCLQRKPIVSCG